MPRLIDFVHISAVKIAVYISFGKKKGLKNWTLEKKGWELESGVFWSIFFSNANNWEKDLILNFKNKYWYVFY